MSASLEDCLYIGMLAIAVGMWWHEAQYFLYKKSPANRQAD